MVTDAYAGSAGMLGFFTQPAPWFSAERGSGSAYLAKRLGWVKPYVHAPSASRQSEESPVGIDELKRHLRKKGLRKPLAATVHGTFYPAVLLFPGWWERQLDEQRSDPKWRDGIQSWLFHGFEQWGPSWDVSYAKSDQRDSYVMGQLAEGDEANSLPVVVPPEKAAPLRDHLAEANGIFEARVKGDVWSRARLSKEMKVVTTGNSDFDYCIVLDADRDDHVVEPTRATTDSYSAYLWKCVAPVEWTKPGVPVRLEDLYFVWEHTDLTRQDAVSFNLDALESKVQAIEHMYGALELVQKSGAIVSGEPAWDTEVFYQYLLASAPPRG